jgi:protein SCO1
VLAAVALTVAACARDAAPPELRGYTREPTPDALGVSLPDASRGGEDFELVADDGGVLLVYFGYTSCPDVCPMTLSDIRVALEEILDDASGVDLAVVTIDPERDTDDVLTGYVDHFFPGGHALRTTDDAQLRRAASAFGATYAVAPAEDGGEPEVMHSGSVYGVDDAGQIVVTWPFGTSAEDFAHDLELLRG